jgi:hypothetical protein
MSKDWSSRILSVYFHQQFFERKWHQTKVSSLSTLNKHLNSYIHQRNFSWQFHSRRIAVGSNSKVEFNYLTIQVILKLSAVPVRFAPPLPISRVATSLKILNRSGPAGPGRFWKLFRLVKIGKKLPVCQVIFTC